MVKETNWKRVVGTVIALIGIVIAFLSLPLINDTYLKQPNIILVQYLGTDTACPFSLFNDFTVKFRNVGEKGVSVCVELEADGINLTKTKSCLFISVEDKAGKDKDVPFKFTINKSSIPTGRELANASITYKWKYDKNPIKEGGGEQTCLYRKDRDNTRLRFVP